MGGVVLCTAARCVGDERCQFVNVHGCDGCATDARRTRAEDAATARVRVRAYLCARLRQNHRRRRRRRRPVVVDVLR